MSSCGGELGDIYAQLTEEASRERRVELHAARVAIETASAPPEPPAELLADEMSWRRQRSNESVRLCHARQRGREAATRQRRHYGSYLDGLTELHWLSEQHGTPVTIETWAAVLGYESAAAAERRWKLFRTRALSQGLIREASVKVRGSIQIGLVPLYRREDLEHGR